jgi:F-type H+-transporting ATPase subunit a
MASGELTSGAYIKHHLQNLTYGKFPDGHWGFAENAIEAKDMGFMAFHVDTLGFSFVLGALFLFLFAQAAKRASIDAPSGFQNFIESIIDFIDDNVRGSFKGQNPMVAPLALTTFIWIVLMNTMDLVPVDWLPVLAQKTGSIFGIDKFFHFLVFCSLTLWSCFVFSRERIKLFVIFGSASPILVFSVSNSTDTASNPLLFPLILEANE